MTVGYRQRKAGLAPVYICQGPREADRIENGYCQRISGYSLDLAIGALLVETVTPLALEVALRFSRNCSHAGMKPIACAGFRWIAPATNLNWHAAVFCVSILTTAS